MMNIKIFTDMIEDEAVKQINTIASMDAFYNAKIRIMPDVHAGKGCVCGFTADLGDKLVPNLVGVDGGCGMLTINLGKIDIDFAKLDKVIRSVIPSGQNINEVGIEEYNEGADPKDCECPISPKDLEYLRRSIGTLGSGNHFIEIDVDKEGNKYLIIHTGSRKLGQLVCRYWQGVAVESIKNEISDEDIDELFS